MKSERSEARKRRAQRVRRARRGRRFLAEQLQLEFGSEFEKMAHAINEFSSAFETVFERRPGGDPDATELS